MQPVGLYVLRYTLIVAAIVAAFYSIVLTNAARLFARDTAISVPAAVHLVPYNGAYAARLAAWEPDKRDALLQRAVQLNPFDAESLIQLGLLAEIQRDDPRTAERDYLRAAEVNKLFLPKWTLANFYFRRQNAAEFFHWASAALSITPYASDPLFTQMWMMSQDADRLAQAIPDRPRILVQYSFFLANRRQFSAIPPIVQRLIRKVGSDDPRAWGRDDLIAAVEDHMLAAGDAHDALQVWASLKEGRWLSQSAPDADHPLTNGGFHIGFYKHGFDWVPVDCSGATLEQFASEGEVRVSLSGNQPDHCVLLQQYVPLEPGGAYSLQWKGEGHSMDAQSGLAWHLRSVPGDGLGREIVSGDLGAAPPKWEFNAPGDSSVALLSLDYARPLGQVRASGNFELRSAGLTLLQRAR